MMEQGWRAAWRLSAARGLRCDAVEAAERMRAIVQSAACQDDAGLYVGVITTAPEGAAPIGAVEGAIDFAISAESALPMTSDLALQPERPVWTELFDAALRRADAQLQQHRTAKRSPVVAGASSLEPQAGSDRTGGAVEASALRWVHVGSDLDRGLAAAKALGARTICLDGLAEVSELPSAVVSECRL